MNARIAWSRTHAGAEECWSAGVASARRASATAMWSGSPHGASAGLGTPADAQRSSTQDASSLAEESLRRRIPSQTEVSAANSSGEEWTPQTRRTGGNSAATTAGNGRSGQEPATTQARVCTTESPRCVLASTVDAADPAHKAARKASSFAIGSFMAATVEASPAVMSHQRSLHKRGTGVPGLPADAKAASTNVPNACVAAAMVAAADWCETSFVSPTISISAGIGTRHCCAPDSTFARGTSEPPASRSCKSTRLLAAATVAVVGTKNVRSDLSDFVKKPSPRRRRGAAPPRSMAESV
mmetsp:Transcript_33376/g.92157  ORF Transcript_33376/g.92157 Transcript_33376/m.92157 type:complete len:298 (-) Transcript_33376:409-1302(-)